ncbi:MULTISPECIES: XrtA system polysaccharide chain length determinant [unclassified Marinobacter]|jgi:polysaccharide chain length determinant protein (PEP-CTERM system associated)|uniref:XrtA system polysaccharide chain length determinant n=1 Tax=unclassified Marinobacter TaxID=83889 RepID=UPI000C5BDAC4|nr:MULTISPECIES: XrtA system polysaccharide chain length determinant [unclassified Marinobacter]MAB50832.1 lipopolysaccharide biosynthesis protein [Marinobacter sp.]MAY34546.1 lipopolysaccharide biosynthesis protein [Spongiibacteraceae bacterium]MBN15529.1 lipopolysaccharide biosynthesis protein [Pelagibacterium sp.]|tara:strand:+ start:1465 stop:2991 length:1527 start_codon:yes stop_codon:yes gene_type:complete
MALPLNQLPKEIVREVRSRKWLALLLFAVVSFSVLAAGFLWPYKYQSQVVIFVDDRNIIQPLMEGRAVATKVTEKVSAARELLGSRNVLEEIATDTEIYGENAADISPEALEGRINGLRYSMSVVPRGDNYFSIRYSSSSPLKTFRVAQKLGQAFIEENAKRKREESRSAYDFIDKQVKSYEQQIAEVEERLKEFLSENVDGTEADANARLSNLQSRLELAQLEKEELQTRARSLERELSGINRTLRQGRTVDAYQERINSMEEQLDSLRLRYHDTYPDIVILREQLQELRKQRERALEEQQLSSEPSGSESIPNPVYQEVRSNLVTTNTDLETVETRISSIKRLITEQKQRMERIQENKAQYSELTRDMEVNKEIYNDLLQRREKARVSMHLDIEGQGLNYKINESAQYPTSPTGPKFSMFAMAGLLLGAVAPFGAIAGLLQVDPRIRSREQLEDVLDIAVLEHLPEVRTPFEKRRDRKVTVAVVVMAVLVAAAYVAVALASVFGVI